MFAKLLSLTFLSGLRMNSQLIPALLLNGILHGTSAVAPALIAATGHEYEPPGVAIIFKVVAAASPLPTFLTLTLQKSEEVWVVFSITRSGAGETGVTALATKGMRSAARIRAIDFIGLFVVRTGLKERESRRLVNLQFLLMILIVLLILR